MPPTPRRSTYVCEDCGHPVTTFGGQSRHARNGAWTPDIHEDKPTNVIRRTVWEARQAGTVVAAEPSR